MMYLTVIIVAVSVFYVKMLVENSQRRRRRRKAFGASLETFRKVYERRFLS
jgi:hypothetical protein